MEIGIKQNKWNPVKSAGSFLLCMIALISLVLLFPQKIHAATDTTAPEVTAIRYVNPVVTKPGVLVLELDILEEETGVNLISVTVGSAKLPYNGSSNTRQTASVDTNSQFTGTVRIEIPLDAAKLEGNWAIREVSLSDNAGNDTLITAYSKAEVPSYYEMLKLNGVETVIPTFTVKDEFDYDFEYSLSNPKLADKLQSMPEGKAAKLLIDKPSNGILPKATFDAIKGKDKTIVAYSASSGYQWIFNGKDIINQTKNIDLNLTLKKQSGTEYGAADDVVAAIFPANGVLPGKAQIRIKSDYIYNLEGIKGNLYLYYLNNGNLENMTDPNFDLVLDGTDKWCYFDITHNSTYLISGNKLAVKKDLTAQTIAGTAKYTKKMTDKSFSLKMRAKTPLSYKSNNPNVVQVTKNGKITVKGIGTAKITVTAAKNQKYAAAKKVVTVTVNPASSSISSASSKSKNTAKLIFKRDNKAAGYQIRYSTNSKFTGKSVKYTTVKNSKTTTATLKKLTSNRKYYVQVRSFKKVNGQTFNSSWSKAKTVKIK